MKISEQGIELIKKFEGFSAKPYFCPADKLTIGYGHVIESGEKFPPLGISQQEAGDILRKDIEIAEDAMARLIRLELTQYQFDALCSFIYNLGAKAFEKSKLLRFINDGEFVLAEAEFSKWVYAGGKKMSGLVRRREVERQMFSGDVDIE